VTTKKYICAMCETRLETNNQFREHWKNKHLLASNMSVRQKCAMGIYINMFTMIDFVRSTDREKAQMAFKSADIFIEEANNM